ncbi:MAG TPA: FAD-binding oxidoreductase [Burkholderiaceae bacterium]
MHRRHLLQATVALPLACGPGTRFAAAAGERPPGRVRPGDADWPSEARWRELGQQVGGRLVRVESPLAACRSAPDSPACATLFGHSLKNPYFLGDEVGLTQTLGWVDAWTSRPSAYAVAAQTRDDVVAAVNFAREHRLRLVVKGGGHSYQGTSNAADSLLIWTRRMKRVTLHDAFVGAGCAGRVEPQRAVSVEAGALWGQVYDAVTTQAGGYVQGGGCMSVGVAGLVQSGGFGSFSKRWGLASANLLEAEVVTADGTVRLANACTNPDLFWGLKGGGGSSLGVVTRLTLRVHELPETFGAVNMTIQATSPAAFQRLIGHVIGFYARSLMNPHWGEQIRMRPDHVLKIAMVFQGMTRGEALDAWQPFLAVLDAAPQDYRVEFSPFKFVSTSAREFWSPTLAKRLFGFIGRDERPGAPPTNLFWPGDQGQAGQVLHGYQSMWLPAALLDDAQRERLVQALYAASRHWTISLHVNKGLAGAPAEVIAAARDTAMNPAVLDAFALVICATGDGPGYPGIAGHEPDVAVARTRAQAIARAMDELRVVAPRSGSYLSESNYFEPDWPRSFWGSNYERLLAVKQRYDPEGLFFVHHGVGSERWSADGFTPQA